MLQFRNVLTIHPFVCSTLVHLHSPSTISSFLVLVITLVGPTPPFQLRPTIEFRPAPPSPLYFFVEYHTFSIPKSRLPNYHTFVTALERTVGEKHSSSIEVSNLAKWRTKYSVPQTVHLSKPSSKERACSYNPEKMRMYKQVFSVGLRFPFPRFIRELLAFFNLSPAQLLPNTWHIMLGFLELWAETSDGQHHLTVEDFLFCYRPKEKGSGWYFFLAE
ncbi:hypothetical protein U1Q18_026169 [Sarracenia purpurea var. burkii]